MWIRGGGGRTRCGASSQQGSFFLHEAVREFRVQAATQCTLGSGRFIDFWHDKWLPQGSLQETFPVLFTFAQDQHCTVQSQAAGGRWEIQLQLPLSMTAQRQLDDLLQALPADETLLSTAEYCRSMVITGKKPTTKDFYTLFSDRGQRWQPAMWVWRKAIPPRRRTFLWLAFRGRLNTKDNMVIKTWAAEPGCDRCPAVESIDHVILHCQYAQWIWERLNLCNEAARAERIADFVSLIQSRTGSPIWPTCFAACGWALWTARNNRLINNKQTSRRSLYRTIVEELTLWASRSNSEAEAIVHWAHIFAE